MRDGDAVDRDAASHHPQQQPASSAPQESSRPRRRRRRNLHLQLAACTPSLRLPHNLLPPRRCICRPPSPGAAAKCSIPARCAGLCDICTPAAVQDVAKKVPSRQRCAAGSSCARSRFPPAVFLHMGHACMDVPNRMCAPHSRPVQSRGLPWQAVVSVVCLHAAELAVAPPRRWRTGGRSFQDSHSAPGDTPSAGAVLTTCTNAPKDSCTVD